MAYVSQKDKAELAPAIKKVLSKYGMKGSISIRHHSTLVVTLQSGAIDFGEYTHGDGYIQVNVYHIERHYKGKAQKFLTELLAAMKGPGWFDKSDSMTDYFHVKHYCDINVGKWNKPYFLQNTAKKASKKPIKASKTTSFNGWTPEVIQGSKGITVPANATISASNDTAETLARMNGKELNDFVDSLMDRYPTLGENIMSQIGYAMLEKEGV
jgi:hypothetical protein